MSVPIGSVFVKIPNLEVSSVLTETRAKLSASADSTCAEFSGVTVRDAEIIDATKGAILRLQKTGLGLALVKGAVEVGDSLVTSPGTAGSALVKQDSVDDVEGSVFAGKALQIVAGGVTKLIRVNFGAGGGVDTSHFPFEIYKSPPNTGEGADPAVAWRTYRVRGGTIYIAGVGDGPVTKTDAAENPDSDPVPAFDGTNIDFVVPSAEGQHWVWIALTYATGNYTGEIKHGSDPTTQGWATYPALDGLHIPVGYIDTDTESASSRAIVRQFLRTDYIERGAGEECPYG
ncbi:MAG: hypothetical protein H7X97_08620 [Opitutaceae bacterium]|nr:hypothetical protein [Verrucomicrobiales bacterium]